MHPKHFQSLDKEVVSSLGVWGGTCGCGGVLRPCLSLPLIVVSVLIGFYFSGVFMSAGEGIIIGW